ncbi:hypothetical protein AGR7A_pAt20227 [Agrobacterium deltaense NCPPB 1641]|uniref:Uncharacterized protein n=1 Tax=Agrobacterium deltaense NCPPB 1641 TaxID=1183425 RepID=A0A1S7U929_9HYPH|nr:hypothetical protein AGR7A_pAt20227 [Agrobacterium deltaense NCPPB 1641]
MIDKKLCFNGSYGAIHGANIAISANATMTQNATVVEAFENIMRFKTFGLAWTATGVFISTVAMA